MAAENITFSINQLLVDNGDPFCIEVFDEIKEIDEEKVEIQNPNDNTPEAIGVRFVQRNTFENRFVTIHISDGEKFPYSNEVVNLESLEHKPNPRSPNEVELDKHLFALVDCKTGLIFFSNQRNRKDFQTWLSRKTKKIMVIKPLITEDEFESKLKTISEISLSIVPNPFRGYESNSLEEMLRADAFGLGAPKAALRFSYKRENVSDNLRRTLRRFMDQTSKDFHVTIIGRTSDGFDSVFNMNEITSRISIEIIKDKMSRTFDAGQMFVDLISKIKEHDEKNS